MSTLLHSPAVDQDQSAGAAQSPLCLGLIDIADDARMLVGKAQGISPLPVYRMIYGEEIWGQVRIKRDGFSCT